MTDRHAAYIVVLGDDIREDDAEHTINALRMIKGVVKVEPVQSDAAFQAARLRVDREWKDRIWEFAREANGIPR